MMGFVASLVLAALEAGLCGALVAPATRPRSSRAYRAAREALAGPGPGAAVVAAGGAALGLAATAAAVAAARAGLGLLLLSVGAGMEGGGQGARAALERDWWRAVAWGLAASGALVLGGAAWCLGEAVLAAEASRGVGSEPARGQKEGSTGGTGATYGEEGGVKSLVRAEAELRLARERYGEAAVAARRAEEAAEAAGRREEAMRRQAANLSHEYDRLGEENRSLKEQLRQFDRRVASGSKKRD